MKRLPLLLSSLVCASLLSACYYHEARHSSHPVRVEHRDHDRDRGRDRDRDHDRNRDRDARRPEHRPGANVNAPPPRSSQNDSERREYRR